MKKAIILILALILCAVSCAVAEESSLPVFANFGEARKASVLCTSSFGHRATAAVEVNGKLYKVIAETDEKGLEMLEDFSRLHKEEGTTEDDMRTAFSALMDYFDTLPVTEVIEFTDVPMTDEEKESFVGKSLREVCKNDEGMDYILMYDSMLELDSVCFRLYRNSFIYYVYVNEDREFFNKLKEDEYYDKLTVKEILYLCPNVA